MATLEARFVVQYPAFKLEAAFSAPLSGVTALFGPSGSGKTTVLRCIAGLERSPAGLLRLGDTCWQDEARGVFLPTHRRALGYVFQEASLFPHLSVRGNLAYGWKRIPPAERRLPFDQVVELLGLIPLLERAPQRLSGGERQRVAVARALLAAPRLLLMDEPLASLDGQSKAEILPYFERLRAQPDVPIVYVSHDAEEVARLADHLVLLREGRVAASGAAPALLAGLPAGSEQGAAAPALVEAVVARHDEAYQLTELDFPGGTLVVPSRGLALGQRVRLRIAARDVSLTLRRQEGSSILNVLPVTVVAIAADSPSQVLVRLDSGGATLLARITRKSADRLGLAPGSACFAQIKSVALAL